LNVHGDNDVRQTEIHTAEPLVPEPSAFEVEKDIENLKRYKSPNIDCIPAELIKAGGSTISSEIHKHINSICKEKLPEQWKESVIVPVYKKDDKTDCSNYHGISLLSVAYKILSNILLSRLTPYAEEILGDHQYGFQCNRSSTDHTFCICQTLQQKWEYNEVVHQLFVDFNKAYDPVRREVLYNILIQFGIPLKLIRFIKMCLNETYSRVRVGKHLSDRFPIKNCLKHGDAFITMAFQLCISICH
jgi:hypothetical protein